MQGTKIVRVWWGPSESNVSVFSLFEGDRMEVNEDGNFILRRAGDSAATMRPHFRALEVL